MLKQKLNSVTKGTNNSLPNIFIPKYFKVVWTFYFCFYWKEFHFLTNKKNWKWRKFTIFKWNVKKNVWTIEFWTFLFLKYLNDLWNIFICLYVCKLIFKSNFSQICCILESEILVLLYPLPLFSPKWVRVHIGESNRNLISI